MNRAMDMPPPQDLISRPEAGRLLGVGPQAIDGLVRRGELHAWRIGERVKLSEKAVRDYLAKAGYAPPERER
jgi:excisionase family DNA binding protein